MSAIKKTSLQLVTESLKKCLTTDETAPTPSLVHNIIAQSYQPQGHVDLWTTFKTTDVIWDNHIGAWKFCQLVHKLLREGNPQFTILGYRFAYILSDLGDYWLKASQVDTFSYYQNYGYCVEKYTTLLVNKIRFHARYPSYPGNLSLEKIDIFCATADENNDSNIFQFAKRVLTYLEDVLNLQDTMFNYHPSTTEKPTSTAAIECRLLGLMPIIEESKNLYFLIVQTLEYLHSRMTVEMLAEHIERFGNIFPRMKNFYYKAQTLHILEGKIWIPDMPDLAPKFDAGTDEDIANESVFSPKKRYVSELYLDKFFTKEDANNNCTLEEEEETEEFDYYDSDFSDSSEEDERKSRKSTVITSLKSRIESLEKQVELLKLQNNKLSAENKRLKLGNGPSTLQQHTRRQTITTVSNGNAYAPVNESSTEALANGGSAYEPVYQHNGRRQTTTNGSSAYAPVYARTTSNLVTQKEFHASTGNLLRNGNGQTSQKIENRKTGNFTELKSFWSANKPIQF